MSRHILLCVALTICGRHSSFGDEPHVIEAKVRSSIERGLVPILSAIERYPSHRKWGLAYKMSTMAVIQPISGGRRVERRRRSN